MGKFIKVTGSNGKSFLLPIHEIELIYPDVSHGLVLGSEILRYQKDRVLVKETIEQIEAQLLRDEFAKAAMNGISSNTSVDDLDAGSVAHDAYLFADAMLKERNK